MICKGPTPPLPPPTTPPPFSFHVTGRETVHTSRARWSRTQCRCVCERPPEFCEVRNQVRTQGAGPTRPRQLHTRLCFLNVDSFCHAWKPKKNCKYFLAARHHVAAFCPPIGNVVGHNIAATKFPSFRRDQMLLLSDRSISVCRMDRFREILIGRNGAMKFAAACVKNGSSGSA